MASTNPPYRLCCPCWPQFCFAIHSTWSFSYGLLPRALGSHRVWGDGDSGQPRWGPEHLDSPGQTQGFLVLPTACRHCPGRRLTYSPYQPLLVQSQLWPMPGSASNGHFLLWLLPHLLLLPKPQPSTCHGRVSPLLCGNNSKSTKNTGNSTCCCLDRGVCMRDLIAQCAQDTGGLLAPHMHALG